MELQGWQTADKTFLRQEKVFLRHRHNGLSGCKQQGVPRLLTQAGVAVIPTPSQPLMYLKNYMGKKFCIC
jgi:hypothetical protein